MLAHVPSFGQNPRGSPDFLAYPITKACLHILGTRVPRRLGVARSASSPKAAQALGCSLTPGLRILFGRVTCIARAASVAGLWALGFLLLCGVCVWVRFAVGCGLCQPRQSWLGSWVGVFGHGLWCCPSFAGCLWFSWLGLSFCLLMRRVWFCARSACPPPFPVPVCGVGVRAGPGSRLCPALLGWVVGVCFLRFCFFLFFFLALWCRLLGFPVPGLVVPVPPSPFFRAGLLALFFFVVCVCMFRCPFSRWAAVPGLVLPVLAGWSPCASLGVLSSVPSGLGVWPPLVVLAGGLVAVGCFRAPPPLPPLFFFGGGGAACSSLRLPWAGTRTGPHSVWSSGLLLAVAFFLAVFRPYGSGGLCTRWARRPFLPGEVLALPAGRLRQAAAFGSGLGG